MLALLKYITIILACSVALYITYAFFFPRNYNFLLLPIEGTIISERESLSPISFLKTYRSLPIILEVMQIAENDPKIRGIFFKINGVDSGWAKLEELRQAILRFNQKGKITVVYLDQGSNKDYFLATAGSKIILAPAGTLNVTGLRLEVLFFAEALEKVGIQPNIYHIGQYKSTAEAFTRTEMSQPHREVLTAILDNLYNHYVDSIALSRKSDPQAIRNLIDQGPFLANEALQAGLVDSTVYEDQVPAMIREELGQEPVFIEARQYHKTMARRDWIRGFFKSRPKLALIYASGIILPGKSRSLPLLGPVMGDETLMKSIRLARENPSIKAVVMRVESRGGSILASDNIWREVELTKKSKPFIVSMGDIAASGGFYISLGATKILAEPGTITGSIGIVYGKFVLKDLYEKLGLHREIISRGKNAGIFSDYTPLTSEQQERLHGQMEVTYEKFLEKVSEGRNMSHEEVEKIAQGRAWTGLQAKDIKLLDELGGLKEALDLAKEMANIPGEKEVKIISFPEKKGIARRMLESFRNPNPFENPAQSLIDSLVGPLLFESFPAQLSEPFLAFPMYVFEIE